MRWTPGRLVEVLSLDADERHRLAETLGDAVATVAVDAAEDAPDPVERADQPEALHEFPFLARRILKS